MNFWINCLFKLYFKLCENQATNLLYGKFITHVKESTIVKVLKTVKPLRCSDLTALY